jgi:hypothetical protein
MYIDIKLTFNVNVKLNQIMFNTIMILLVNIIVLLIDFQNLL